MELNCSIEGKVALITGGGNGIGSVTSMELMKRGLRKLIVADIDLVNAEKTVSLIRKKCGLSNEEGECRVVAKYLDLSSLTSVRLLAYDILANERELHLLVNNAGINPPSTRQTTIDGFELTFQTNYLGHFLLTNLLLDLLKQSSPSRIVMVASDGYMFCWPNGLRVDDLQIEKRKFDFWDAYCQSKLAILLFARKLNKQLRNERSSVSVFTLHPGMVNTTILKHRSKTWQYFVSQIVYPLKFIVISPEKGAKTTVYCASKAGIEKHSGKHFLRCSPAYRWKIAKDDTKAEALWKISQIYCIKHEQQVYIPSSRKDRAMCREREVR